MGEKVAVKSGYYFQIFDKDDIPETLKKSETKIYINGITYDLYTGTSLEDERKIDELFGNQKGYSISAHTTKIEKKPKCALIGADGNIFNLMGLASRTLKHNQMSELANEMCDRVSQSHSYDEALYIISEYVEITDEAGLEEEEEFE